MFYVSRGTGKIYSDTFDKNGGFYPQVEFSRLGQELLITTLKTGSPSKPLDRQICTLDEVSAQLGLGNQPELAEPVAVPVEKKPRKKLGKGKPGLVDATDNKGD